MSDTDRTNYMHSQLINQLGNFIQIADTSKSTSHIKDKGTTYLPMTSGMLAQKDLALQEKIYNTYKTRAVFYIYVKKMLIRMKSILCRNAPNISVPVKMEKMLEEIGVLNENVFALQGEMYSEQVYTGRVFLLADLSIEETRGLDVYPRIAIYKGASIMNWGYDKIDGVKKLSYVLLDESESVQKDGGLAREWEEKYRICALDKNGLYYTYQLDREELSTLIIKEPPENKAIYPNIRDKRLNEIPCSFLNANSISSDMSEPPLLEVSDLSLAIYRGEADYRQSIYNAGTGTPWGTGIEKPETFVMGAGSFISSQYPEARFGMLEISGESLSEQREALNDLHKRIEDIDISLTEAGAGESGDALDLRIETKIINLYSITKWNCEALENILRIIADWMGLNRDEVQITPNYEFIRIKHGVTQLRLLSDVTANGYMRMEDYYNWLVANDFTDVGEFELWLDDLKNNPITNLDAETMQIINGLEEEEENGDSE